MMEYYINYFYLLNELDVDFLWNCQGFSGRTNQKVDAAQCVSEQFLTNNSKGVVYHDKRALRTPGHKELIIVENSERRKK